jgi:hypothetical protein
MDGLGGRSLMDVMTLSRILGKIPPAASFNILADEVDESNYGADVAYKDPSLKPTWAQVQDGVAPEQWEAVRGKRLLKLRASDWTQLDDVPITNTKLQEWQTHRQVLRDITTQSDPFNITWPTPPA